MARVGEMQGVPAYIEFLKTNDKKRRHPAHCVYAVGKGKERVCDCPNNPKWREKCQSSARCDDYIEKE